MSSPTEIRRIDLIQGPPGRDGVGGGGGGGGVSPSGNGIPHVVGGVTQPAASKIDLAADVTGILPSDKVGLPTATVTNSVLQRLTDGTYVMAPLTLDQIGAAYAITFFGPATGAVEVGTAVATPTLSASYSSTPTSAILTDDQGTSPKDVTASYAAFTSNATFTKTANGASVTFTLSAHDAASPTKTRTTSIAWYPRIHYGTGTPGLRNAAAILALASNPLASSRVGSFAYAAGNTGANLKCYFAIPSSYGTPTFKSGGLPFAISAVATGVSVTSNGVTQNYDFYESDNVGLGTFTLDVT